MLPPPKRKSIGATEKMDARILKLLADRQLKLQTARPTGVRAVAGYIFLGISAIFMVAEFFHVVAHANTISHWVMQGTPLILGLMFAAPDVVDRLKELLMWAVSVFAKFRKIKISLPEEEKE